MGQLEDSVERLSALVRKRDDQVRIMYDKLYTSDVMIATMLSALHRIVNMNDPTLLNMPFRVTSRETSEAITAIRKVESMMVAGVQRKEPGNRFKVVPESLSLHDCCFTHTVVDTEILISHSKEPTPVCECSDEDYANLIRDTLNAADASGEMINHVPTDAAH
jgi:hypothetical protein